MSFCHIQDLDVVGTSCGNRHKGTNSRHESREVILILIPNKSGVHSCGHKNA